MAPDRNPRNEPAGKWAGQGRYLGYGMAAALSTFLFFLVGLWLDRRFGTTPLLTFGGAFFGGVAGFYNLYVHIVVEPEQKGEE